MCAYTQANKNVHCKLTRSLHASRNMVCAFHLLSCPDAHAAKYFTVYDYPSLWQFFSGLDCGWALAQTGS